jgi:chorismate-pyruvate lyase
MRNGGRVLLAALNWYIRIKIREVAFDPNHSVKVTALSVAASIQKLPDSVFKSVSRANRRLGRCVRRNDQVIDQFEVSR